MAKWYHYPHIKTPMLINLDEYTTITIYLEESRICLEGPRKFTDLGYSNKFWFFWEYRKIRKLLTKRWWQFWK